MAIAFALAVVALGAALLWMGWHGKKFSDVYALVTGKGTA